MIDRPLVAYGVISLILGVFAFSVIGPLSVLLLLFGPVFIVLGLFAKGKNIPTRQVIEPSPIIAPIAVTPAIPTKFCRFCRAKIPRESKFCEECGKALA